MAFVSNQLCDVTKIATFARFVNQFKWIFKTEQIQRKHTHTQSTVRHINTSPHHYHTQIVRFNKQQIYQQQQQLSSYGS